uniref:Uncharacterized protein n=1 Tax=Talaromyces marneffei PM1 TaxID=1077442 RepID=A0A093UYG9_TALMA
MASAVSSRRCCEGYATNARKNVAGPVELRWDSRRGHGASPGTIMTQLLVDPDSLDFRYATAFEYFQEFVRLVQGPWIVAASNDDLWEVTLPQVARTTTCSALLHSLPVVVPPIL